MAMVGVSGANLKNNQISNDEKLADFINYGYKSLSTKVPQVDGAQDTDSDDEALEMFSETLPVEIGSAAVESGDIVDKTSVSNLSDSDFNQPPVKRVRLCSLTDVCCTGVYIQRDHHDSGDIRNVPAELSVSHQQYIPPPQLDQGDDSDDFQIADASDDSFDSDDFKISNDRDELLAAMEEEHFQIAKSSVNLVSKEIKSDSAVKDLSVYDFDSDNSDSTGSDSDFAIADECEVVESTKVELPRSECCQSKCCTKVLSDDIKNELQQVIEMKRKIDIKNELLWHLRSQQRMGLITSGFWFGGNFMCRKYFSEVSGVSQYILAQVMEDHESGLVQYEHGNNGTAQFSVAATGFICWMRSFSNLYGQSAPDTQVKVLPSWLKIKDLFEIYCDEVEEPKVKSSTFYHLFEKCFGCYREDKTLPHIRLSAWSTHSRCDQCIALNRYQRSCRTEESLAHAKSLKMTHRECYGRARIYIESLRHLALDFPHSRLFIQIDDMGKGHSLLCVM